jgi:hypothetical protein
MVFYLGQKNREMDQAISQTVGETERENAKKDYLHREHSSLSFRYML